MPDPKKRSRWSALSSRLRRRLPLDQPASYQQVGEDHSSAEDGERPPPPPAKRRLIRRRYIETDVCIARLAASAPQGASMFTTSFPQSQQQQQSEAVGTMHRCPNVSLDSQSFIRETQLCMGLKRWTLRDKEPRTSSERWTEPFAFTFSSNTIADKGRVRAASLHHTSSDVYGVGMTVGVPSTVEDSSFSRARVSDVRVHGRRNIPGFTPTRIDEVIAEVDEVMSTDEGEMEEFHDACEYQC